MSEQEKAREKQVPEEENTHAGQETPQETASVPKDAKPEQPVANSGGDAGAVRPSGGKKFRWQKRYSALLAAALFVVIGVAALIRQSAPAEPAGAPASSMAPSSAQPGDDFEYPENEAIDAAVFSSIHLLDEGFVEIVPQSWFGNNNDDIPLTLEYLQNCLELSPSHPFTVTEEQGTFRVYIEGMEKNSWVDLILPYRDGGEEDARRYTANTGLCGWLDLKSGYGGAAIDAPVRVEFNAPVSPESARGRVLLRQGEAGPDQIAPAIPCDVSYEERAVLLTPHEMLDYGAYYTVELASTLVSVDGARMGKLDSLPFSTEQRAFSISVVDGNTNLFRPGADIELTFEVKTEWSQGVDAKTELFRLTGVEAYQAVLTGADTQPDEAGDTGTVHLDDGFASVTYDNPGVGYYLFRCSVMDQKTGEPVVIEKPFMVSTTAVYLQAAGESDLIWLNDCASGEALGGYTVVFTQAGEQVARFVTEADGTALFSHTVVAKTPTWGGLDADSDCIFTIYDPDGKAVYTDRTACLGWDSQTEERYYSFFYLDRALYRPTDTVNFWGYVKPYRMNRGAMPTQVEVVFDEGGLDERVTVSLNADGTFSGSLSYEQVASSQYGISARMLLPPPYLEDSSGNPVTTHHIDTIWVDIKDFVTPAYTISSSVDKPIYRSGDTVSITITPTFYDGTPLPDYPIEFSVFNPTSGNFEAIQKLTTDEKGVAYAAIKAGENMTAYFWRPTYGYYYIKIANDGETVSHQGSYIYTPGNVILRPEVTFDAHGARLRVLANSVTLEGVRDAEQAQRLADAYDDDAYDVLIGDPVDMQLSVETDLRYFMPREQGEDDTSDRHIWDEENIVAVEVKDGAGTAELLAAGAFDPSEYGWVSVTASYVHDGNTLSSSASASYSGGRRRAYRGTDETAPKGYTFNVYRGDEPEPVQTYEEYLGRSFVETDVGVPLQFELLRDGVPVQGGRMIYTLVQDDIIGRGSADTALTLTPDQKHANSVLLVAAYFVGHDVYAVANCYIRINQESLALEIETALDKETYMPGDTVTLSAKVRDKNGNPVSAQMCVSIVDEAVFALREQYFDILASLYGEMNFYNYYIYKYTSLTGDINPFNNSGDGGKGAGDNLEAYDIFRDDFRDTAFFKPLQSDQDGSASLSFTLPDNITSWRITTLAVGNNLYAGASKSNLVTTLPFFTKPVLSPKYIEGDEVTMLIQGHGTAVKTGDVISYEVRVTGDGVDKTYTRSGTAYEPVEINLGKLAEGDYTVTSTGQFGQMRDTVELPLSVISSNLELIVNREIDLQKPVDIEALRYPVVITLYDDAYRAYNDSISSLLRHYCFRIDQRMARFAAKRALMQFGDSEDLPRHIRVSDSDVLGYQNFDGGIGWYTYSDQSDPVVTMKVLMFAGDMYDLERMKGYFEAVKDDQTRGGTERAAAYAGLAAIDPAYTADIREILASQPDMKLKEQLYYVAGLAYGGDEAGALAYYEKFVTPRLRHDMEGAKWLEYSNAVQEYERLKENDDVTAAAWITASKLNLPDADGFAAHFARNRWRIDSIFECMIYVVNYGTPATKAAKFSYTSGGELHEVDLAGYGRKLITLNRSEMQDLAFHDVPDSVRAAAYYIGEPEEAGFEGSGNISMQKDFQEMEGGKYKVTLTVTFEDDAPYGFYNISDWVPSNMRLHTIAKQPQSSRVEVHSEQENQKLYFDFYRTAYTPKTVYINYYTQRTFDTQAVADRAYLICAETGDSAFTERGRI